MSDYPKFILLKNGMVEERHTKRSDALQRIVELSQESPRAAFELAVVRRRLFYIFTPGTSQQVEEAVS